MDKLTDGWANVCLNKQIGEIIDGWIDKLVDGWTGKWIERWMGRLMN